MPHRLKEGHVHYVRTRKRAVSSSSLSPKKYNTFFIPRAGAPPFVVKKNFFFTDPFFFLILRIDSSSLLLLLGMYGYIRRHERNTLLYTYARTYIHTDNNTRLPLLRTTYVRTYVHVRMYIRVRSVSFTNYLLSALVCHCCIFAACRRPAFRSFVRSSPLPGT